VEPSDVTTLAVFDLDGTLTVGDNHARLLLGLLRDPRVTAATKLEIVGGSLAYLAGRLPNAWTKAVIGRAWQGRSRGELEAAMERFCRDRILPGGSPPVLARLRRHLADGHRVVLLSASLDLMVAPVARALGIPEHRGVDLAFDPQGRVLPALDGPCYDGHAKATWLAGFAAREGLELANAWGYGNSHGDRHFLALVGHPVAVGPNRLLRTRALREGWEILEHGTEAAS
jgi:putative phosphoserine phosphatase/1-acylglycerol-3-phosphate O-acyltransferase